MSKTSVGWIEAAIRKGLIKESDLSRKELKRLKQSRENTQNSRGYTGRCMRHQVETTRTEKAELTNGDWFCSCKEVRPLINRAKLGEKVQCNNVTILQTTQTDIIFYFDSE